MIVTFEDFEPGKVKFLERCTRCGCSFCDANSPCRKLQHRQVGKARGLMEGCRWSLRQLSRFCSSIRFAKTLECTLLFVTLHLVVEVILRTQVIIAISVVYGLSMFESWISTRDRCWRPQDSNSCAAGRHRWRTSAGVADFAYNTCGTSSFQPGESCPCVPCVTGRGGEVVWIQGEVQWIHLSKWEHGVKLDE